MGVCHNRKQESLYVRIGRAVQRRWLVSIRIDSAAPCPGPVDDGARRPTHRDVLEAGILEGVCASWQRRVGCSDRCCCGNGDRDGRRRCDGSNRLGLNGVCARLGLGNGVLGKHVEEGGCSVLSRRSRGDELCDNDRASDGG